MWKSGKKQLRGICRVKCSTSGREFPYHTLYCPHTSAVLLEVWAVSAALKDRSRALALRGLSINVSKTVAMVIAPHSRACQSLPTDVRLLLKNEPQNRCFTMCLQTTDTVARRQYFVSVIQPGLEYAASSTIPFMLTGQQDFLMTLWRKAVRFMAGLKITF